MHRYTSDDNTVRAQRTNWAGWQLGQLSSSCNLQEHAPPLLQLLASSPSAESAEKQPGVKMETPTVAAEILVRCPFSQDQDGGAASYTYYDALKIIVILSAAETIIL